MKKKIDEEIFRVLYDEGLSASEIATYFDVSVGRVCVRKCELGFGEREIPCEDCQRLFITDTFRKFRCDVCYHIRREQFLLRRMFYRMLKNKPELAKRIEAEMIKVDGVSFRELALNGLSAYDD